mmetsp:Transcript_39304/g.73351  ORF Transcript_39304/g.73351 Transcript_39304/m.73351 type:complete len:88 (-) Transcript_39304:70-333(-)
MKLRYCQLVLSVAVATGVTPETKPQQLAVPAPSPSLAPAPALTAVDVAPQLEKSVLRAKRYADSSEAWAVAAREAAKAFKLKDKKLK